MVAPGVLRFDATFPSPPLPLVFRLLCSYLLPFSIFHTDLEIPLVISRIWPRKSDGREEEKYDSLRWAFSGLTLCPKKIVGG
jgi:hypothetical protein